MKYHYSYFIYPYVVKESRYRKYIQSLMQNKKIKPKFFEMKKDLNIYNYFLPEVRKYLFKSFESTKEEMLKNIKTNNCMVFEYDIGNDAQAKVENDGRYFF